ncbi:MAG: exodeoxyribonuclease V subunit beta [Pseudomonadales bacterium]|nr:exodeoxyribonuclease V subunit beta [Pseudomonadales bacterium]
MKVNTLDSKSFPISSNRLIEASAGTGKTYTITNLYLRLLLGRDDSLPAPMSVENILVLTFTIAATEELRGRIRRRIVQARNALAQHDGGEDDFLAWLIDTSDSLERDTRLLSAALQLLDEAAIFTIHGFCARVLADNAFETGALFEQNLDADRDELLQTAVLDCYRTDILTLEGYRKEVALALWPSPDVLQAKVKPFLFRHGLTLLPAPADIDGELATLLGDVEIIKTRWLSEGLEAIMRNTGFRANARCLTWLGNMREWCESASTNPAILEYWTTNYMTSRILKAGKLPVHPVVDLIDELWEKAGVLEQVRYNLWHLVTRRIKDNLDTQKTRLAQLTLDDLLTRVQAALAAPGAGDRLARSLGERWPVAMIDEFQDTDDVQYDIFHRIHHNNTGHCLVFVGDPKQAIYQFRGADVFTYINAKRAIDVEADVFSLGTNWRSTPQVIDATNHLFDKPLVFGNDRDIPFAAVDAAPGAGKRRFVDHGKDATPFAIVQLSADGEPLTKDPARRLTMAWAAEEVVRLLNGARAGEVTIDGEPLGAGQIAFLVRDRHDARAARDALAARNIDSVYVTLESVFLTETADDLKVILQAVAEPTNERLIRAALAVPLMQGTAAEIDALGNDVQAQQRILKEFQEYHDLWARMDIAPMIEALTFRRGIAGKWFGKQRGERQLTNLRHLAELLQERSAIAPGMHRLLKWFTREKLAAETVAAEERQLRLESDRNLVQIVTMHAAKGLEYEIVMIPMAGFSYPPRSGEPSLFHTEVAGRFHTALDFSDDKNHEELAYEESVAEDTRLLYVAITRAMYKCYIGIPNLRDLKKTAIAKLLGLTRYEPDDVEEQLRHSLPPEAFEIIHASSTTTSRWSGDDRPLDLSRPPPRPIVRDDWRLHSYTGLSRLVEAATEEAETPVSDIVTPGFGDDDSGATSDRATRLDRFSFPRGPRAGVALHTLLESLDFTAPVKDQQRLIQNCLDRIGLVANHDRWATVLATWMTDILNAPLPCGCKLSDLGRPDRLDEMEFHFPLECDNGLLGLVQSGGYLPGAGDISIGDLRGSMTGLIDLVFRHDGKFYVIDYKSNHLGDTELDYAPERLGDAIAHHRYDLQYLIYCVALHRYLASRVTGYVYDEHFGGVMYLFLRGMSPSSPGNGIFQDRPDAGFLDRLDARLGGQQ